jgi:hypothetical protein
MPILADKDINYFYYLVVRGCKKMIFIPSLQVYNTVNQPFIFELKIMRNMRKSARKE